MWESLNAAQRRIAKIAAALLALMIVFPPIYTEAVVTGLRSGDSVVGFEMRDFSAWGRIWQNDLTIFAGKKRLQDPDDMSPMERWEFMSGTSLEDLMAMPLPKVAYGVLALQLLILFVGTAAAIYFARDSVP